MKKLINVALLSVATLSGCASQVATINFSASQKLASEKSQSFFLSGIGQEKTVNAAYVCGSASKVASVESTQRPVDIALGVVTAGIYTPRTAKVYCK